MTLLFSHFLQSLRRPDHWVYGSWLDTVTKYRKTRLGALWTLMPTAVYVWGLGGFLAALQPGLDQARFLAHIGVGFVVFRLMSTVLSDATSMFLTYKPYIYDGHLRLTDYVLRTQARAFYYFVLSQPIVAIVVIASPAVQPMGIVGSLGGLVVVMVNLFLYAVLLGAAGARFPDMHEFMSSAMMVLFLITPIVWYPESAPAGTPHGALMRANPFHHLMIAIRGPLLGEPIEPMTYVYLGVMTLLGLLGAAVVYRGAARRIPIWL
ncbi:hypothetical protein V1318_09675 [Lysobacter sp. CCNWLW3]|uniref:ABC transporter permease n=1 Tax=unclassified Lysobacter TaxID=2635362 RepID=UPI002FD59B4D